MKSNLIVRWCQWSAVAALLAGGVCRGSAAGVPGTNALTLDRAVQIALANSPELQAAGAQVTAAAGRAWQARAWTNPELELSTEELPVSGGRGFSDAKQMVGISQTLPYPGKKSLDRRLGGAGVTLSEAELAVRRTEVVREVKESFFRVLAAEQRVAISRQLVDVAEATAGAAARRVEAGAAAEQERLRAAVQLEHVRAEWTDFQRDLALARQGLAMVLGRPDLTEVGVTGVLATAPDDRLLAGAGGEPFAGHPKLGVAQAQLDRARMEYRRARLHPYPDVRAGVSGGRIGETDQSIVQFSLSVPLPLLDRGKGREQEALANVSVAEFELRVVQQRLHRDWTGAQTRYRSAAAQVVRYRERVLPPAEAALSLVQDGFEQGKLDFLNLMDTQRAVAEARLACQQRLLEMNLAQVELESLLPPQSLSPATNRHTSIP